MGLYPKAAEIFAVFDARSPGLKKCFTSAGATNDDWDLSARIFFGKDNARSVTMSMTRAGGYESGGVAAAVEACAQKEILSWPWPSTTGIDGSNGGPGYLVAGAGFHWRRR